VVNHVLILVLPPTLVSVNQETATVSSILTPTPIILDLLCVDLLVSLVPIVETVKFYNKIYINYIYILLIIKNF
jgi:hypothetical protein